MEASETPQPAKSRSSWPGCLLVAGVLVLLACLLIPQVERVKQAAPRMQSSNNLKQIGLGMHNYDAAECRLPPQAICSKEGKPLLSWRVAILPYIEEDQLYNSFKLDEPWDSEHNIALVARMPRVYHHPLSKLDRTKGLTHYQVFAGNNTAFAMETTEEGTRRSKWSISSLSALQRTTENMIFCIEAGEPVIWSKPEDWDYDPLQPIPSIKCLWKGNFMALKADGVVIGIRKDFKESALRAAIDPNSTSKETLD